MCAAIWWPGEDITSVLPSGGQVRILQLIYLVVFPSGYVRILQYTVYSICTVFFRNILPPWSSQMTLLLTTSAMYHIRYKSGEYKFKRKKNLTDHIITTTIIG